MPTTIATSDITINNDLLNFIPRPETTSRNLLLKSIEKDGVREPITTTYLDNKLTIIDGHTRFTIACELGLKTLAVEILEDVAENITAIKERMLKIQLGRRNLNEVDFNLFIGRLNKLRNNNTIANEFGVSEVFVARASKFVDNLTTIEEVGQASIDTLKVLPKKTINILAQQVKLAPTTSAKQRVVNNVLEDNDIIEKQASTISLDDLTPNEQEVIRTLQRDGIAVAKMNKVSRGESVLERYCKQENIYLRIDKTNKVFNNPFPDGSINKFQAYLGLNDDLIENLPTTHGKVLFCHCYPKPCHGDIIKKAALGQFDFTNLVNNVLKCVNK